MKTAIVIGAGISGLSSALRLQSQGYSVTVIEKNSFIGGKTSLITNKYNTFNLTATIPILFKSFVELFEEIGEDLNYYIKYKRLDPFCKAFFKDGTSFEFSSDLKKLSENLSSEDFEDYLDLVCDAKKRYLNINNKSSSSNLPLKKLSSLAKLNFPLNTYDYFRRNLSNKNLVEALAFQSMHTGLSPFENFNSSSLIPLINSINGVVQIEGGIISFVKALNKIFIRRGGNYLLNTPVDSLIFENNNCIGVITNKGESIKASKIICTADFQYTFKNLIPKNIYIENYSVKEYEKNHSTSSTFILYLSIKKDFPNLSTHNIFINKDFKENIEAAFKGKLPKNPHLYIYKDNYNKDITNLNIILHVPNLLYLNDSFWTKDNIIKIEDLIFRTLEDFLKLRQLSSFIVDKKSITPITYKKEFNNYTYSYYGAQNISSLDFFKQDCKIENLNNIYFAGDSINPGTGIYNVLNSSKIAVKTLINDIKIRK